ncbi:MAG: hypothetical protein K6F87_00890 [Lachnospiraceae bacterium]|nr:hypothetical protein [Lachnospiraceae bacterium]
MMRNDKSKIIKTAIFITAAVIAAVFLVVPVMDLFRSSDMFLPDYATSSDKTIKDEGEKMTVVQKGRGVTLYRDGTKLWELERSIRSQDILLEDIDHDSQKELLILCWKRGRFGKHKPTWVKEDEKGYSQHIFIYEINEDSVRPKWMASDIGMDAAAWDFNDGVLSITDTHGFVTNWVWISWGLEKL